ncbi:hypothetical protein BDZ45DRAFT_787526 [Acephala macrosclerotiorum]|nr:hypothetical protein BDZ45DRAFT_787526 [Acephala macrosclerotiorum]
MLFNRENSRHMNTNDTKEALAYIYGLLTTDFELDITVKEKSVFGVRDTSTFFIERHRVQFALILLLFFAIGCRPAELVDAKKKKRRRPGFDDNKTSADNANDESFDNTKIGANIDFGFDNDHDSAVIDLGSENDNNSSNDDVAMSDVKTELKQFDALCYEDVRLLVVRNPVAGESDVLAMEVKLAHYKGHTRRPKPSIACTLLNWKQEMLKTPIFRRNKRTADGVITSLTLALIYSQFKDCLNRLGLATNFLEKLTNYCFRRRTANIVDHQVIRHNPNSTIYNEAYIDKKVPFDVLSIVLERPSTNGILRIFTHMSLMRDPRAPVHVPDDVLAALPSDPYIVDLEQQQAQLKAETYRIQRTEMETENTEQTTSAAARRRTSRGKTVGRKKNSISSR